MEKFKAMQISLTKSRDPKNDGKVQVHYSDIYMVANATISLIDCEDVLDYVEDRTEILKECINKLEYGGKIIVRGLDFISFAEQFSVHRQGLPALMKRKSVSHLEEMRDIVKSLGLNILNCVLTGDRYIIEAGRKGVNDV